MPEAFLLSIWIYLNVNIKMCLDKNSRFMYFKMLTSNYMRSDLGIPKPFIEWLLNKSFPPYFSSFIEIQHM